MSAATATPAPARAVTPPSVEAIRAALLAQAQKRGAEQSFCPSQPARGPGAEWRHWMPDIRAQAARLQDQGLIKALQRGQPVRVNTARRPIRLCLRSVEGSEK